MAKLCDYEKYLIKDYVDPESYKLIEQKGVVRTPIKTDEPHNAIWDFIVTKKGNVYFSLCGELHFSVYARLYEYVIETGEIKELFKLEEKICQQDDAIRASKIHTSISEMNDGRLIMTTHTTAKAPQHPQWLPEGFYAHPWEGFQGGNIIIYDPKTGQIENRGVPVPYESIYGAAYDSVKNILYFNGYFRGHTYSYNIDTGKVKDFGQTSEFGSFRLAVGPDKNIYCNSRSGVLYRIDVREEKLVDIGIRLPKYDKLPQGESHRQLDYTENGPDGKMYIAEIFSQNLMRYDPKINTLEEIGDFRPEGIDLGYAQVVHGLSFDENNVLWYTIIKMDELLQSRGVQLCSWDIFGGGKPQYYGLIGVKERALVSMSEMGIYNGILYMPDANYCFEKCAVISIDLKEQLNSKAEGRERIFSDDPFIYLYSKNGPSLCPDKNFEKTVETPLAYMKECEEWGEQIEENAHFFKAEDLSVVRLWEYTDTKPQSAVNELYFANGVLKGTCSGESVFYYFEIEKGELKKIEKTAEHTKEKVQAPDFLKNAVLPCVPGRQWKRGLDNFKKLWDGRYIASTMDGMLAIVSKNGGVFSLGSAIQTNGRVNDFAVDFKNKIVYGVAGSKHDVGNIFSYDDKNGLLQLGRTYFNRFKAPGIASSCELSAIAVSDDGNTLAVGSKDRLGCVYIYKLR